MSDSNWYAVFVRSKMEKQIGAVLSEKGFEVCVPLYRCRRRWSDRYKWLDLPLFPTYLFCRLALRQKNLVLTTPGVIRLVSQGPAPLPVGEEEMNGLLQLCRSGVQAHPLPAIPAGSRVRIKAGALAGVEGILLEERRVSRVVLSVSLLNRAVCVEIDGIDIEPSESSNPLARRTVAVQPQ